MNDTTIQLNPGTAEALGTTPAGSPARSRRRLRSVGAVLAGLATIFVLSSATDALLHGTGVYPPPGQPMEGWLFLLATAYRIIYGIAGCYLTARLAPDWPYRHAFALGFVGLALSTIGAVVMWDAGPAWYSLAIIAISLPCAWAGAALNAVRR